MPARSATRSEHFGDWGHDGDGGGGVGEEKEGRVAAVGSRSERGDVCSGIAKFSRDGGRSAS